MLLYAIEENSQTALARLTQTWAMSESVTNVQVKNYHWSEN